MAEKTVCPFCNFKTVYPEKGRVHDCQGECFATYTLTNDAADETRLKVRLVEVFFLDDEYNIQISPHEIDKKCEFLTIPADATDEKIVFARQKRIIEEDIEKLQKAGTRQLEIGIDTLDRLRASLSRFELSLSDNDYPRKKLVNEITVVETLARLIKEKLKLG